MKLFIKLLLIILFCFPLLSEANERIRLTDKPSEAIKLQHKDPYGAIKILESLPRGLNSLSPEDKTFVQDLLLLRLYVKVQHLDKAIILMEQLQQAHQDKPQFKNWLAMLNGYVLSSNLKYSAAEIQLDKVNPDDLQAESETFNAWYFIVKASLLVAQNNFEPGLVNLNLAQVIADKYDAPILTIAILEKRLLITYFQQDYQKVLDDSDELIRLARTLEDKFTEVGTLSSKMNSYYMLMIKHGNEADNESNPVMQSQHLQHKQQFTDLAKQSISDILTMSRAIKAVHIELRALILLQSLHIEAETFGQALAVSSETIALAKQYNLPYELGVAYNNMSIAYREMGRFDEAITALNQAHALYEEVENEQSLLWVLEDFSIIYQLMNDHQQALEYYKQWHEAQLALIKKTNSNQVIELQELFQNQKNLNEIEQLKQQNQLHSEKLKSKNIQQAFAVCFVISLIIFVISIWHRNRAVHAKNLLLDELNEKLTEQAIIDPLSGLYNRRFFTELQHNLSNGIERQMIDNPQTTNRIGLVLIDIDLFKNINDTYGHDVGDEVIQNLASRLKNICRKSDYVIRWGGEEFLVVLPDTTQTGLKQFCQKLLDDCNQSSIVIDESEITLNVTVSFGASTLPLLKAHPQWLTWNESIKLVDNLLYCAKQTGRNRGVMINGKNIDDTMENKQQLLSSPTQAFQQNEPWPMTKHTYTLQPFSHDECRKWTITTTSE
ncbi:diguanylate cyclase [Shewanella maritima]|uniref:diguanylate cyclase n=1 Tax=Shewanella maritima TaxID=2520507 RepID=UPI003736BAE5